VRHNVHKLICEAFLGPKPDGLITRHLDGDPTNNKLSNLAYGTHKENEEDKRKHGNTMLGEKHHQAKLTADDVVAIRGSKQSQNQLARCFGVTQATIWRILHRKSWAHV
jgi:hypothetical protein